jgi:rhamnosyltransferase subunit B
LKALLIAIGSHGDVHPFAGLGATLAARGHDVTVVTNSYFEPLVRKLGLGFASVGTADEYKMLADNPDLWHPTRGFNFLMEQTLKLLGPVYDTIAERYVPGETVVVASTLAFGARVAQEKLNVPTASAHLQPSIVRTVYETPRLAGSPMRVWQPRWLKRAIWKFADAAFIDRGLAPGINAFRAEKGLPPVKGIMDQWWHSPQLALGLFPEWFGAPQPDWPSQMRLTGFPLYDERGVQPLDETLVRFLDVGDKPIAFTPGSAMWHARGFFDAAVEACRILGRRGVLLTRHRGHVPPALPPGVIHVDFAPFSELLPRCAALVHHGGVGTLSQGLRAGVPHLVTPMAHDQPDNAERLERLGVARWVWWNKLTGRRAAANLKELIESPDVARACSNVKQKFEGVTALEDTARLIEQLVASRPSDPAAPLRYAAA